MDELLNKNSQTPSPTEQTTAPKVPMTTVPAPRVVNTRTTAPNPRVEATTVAVHDPRVNNNKYEAPQRERIATKQSMPTSPKELTPERAKVKKMMQEKNKVKKMMQEKNKSTSQNHTETPNELRKWQSARTGTTGAR